MHKLKFPALALLTVALAACAESSASAARERWIMSTQFANACARTVTKSFNGPSFRHPSESKASSETWPR